ncbi:FAD-dependent oxidoreductase [Halopseudomonas nanhaiensis]|uniref:FAD-dependent oxidoreductase n=1 Tax=Halopseudomonas nanhaiensis TaxID=2830842 RepID=UPI001CC08FC6|nr:FAD-dependent oxidoreductase [Halopseudomonas nanhaiensis]
MNDEQRPLVLLGGGHAHVVALREWLEQRRKPPAGSLLISPDRYGWYSGMMPGLLAGRYRLEDCRIDLRTLCRACGVELWIDSASGLDADQMTLRLGSGNKLQAELLSLNIGSVPPLPDISNSVIEVLPAKPFSIPVAAWQRWRTTGAPRSMAVLGGGAAAFELAMALNSSLPDCEVQIISGSSLLGGHHQRVHHRARQLLAGYGVSLTEHCHVTRVHGDELFADDRSIGHADAVIVATGAGAFDWPRHSGLACQDGFVRIDATLRSVSHRTVFATGDCAALPRTPHAGVYAVRQGKTLAANLMAALHDQPMERYHPQRRALALLATGDGRALLSYGAMAAHNRLLGRWKDHLDTAFIRA